MKTTIGSRNNRIINLTGLSIILAAVLLKWLNKTACADINLSPLVSLLYLLFFGLWMRSLGRRVIHRPTKFFLLLIAAMEFFWILIRSVKYEIPMEHVTLCRYLWYFYYLPELLIPALFMILAILTGKPENEKPRGFLWGFPVTSLALFFLVLTNDLHRTVFFIPPGIEGIEQGNYSYEPGFYVIFTYIGLCTLASYGIILVKCRVKNGRLPHFLPLIPLAVGTVASIAVATSNHILFGIYHLDITVDLCLTVTCTLEACMQSGLILTNNGYDELFRLSSIRALITDDAFVPVIASESYSDISDGDLRRAAQGAVMLGGGLRLSEAPIKSGHILWQDDVSELNRVLEELAEINDYLAGKSAALQQAYAYKKKERRLIEKNRLYSDMLLQTKPEIERYGALIEALSRETEPEKEKALAVKIAFVSAFIKRRDNLIFLSEEEPIAPSELYYCVEESLSALRLGGADCLCAYELSAPLTFSRITGFYEVFYRVLLSVMEVLSSVCVYLVEPEGGGLGSLRKEIEQDGGSMRVDTGGGFTVTVMFPAAGDCETLQKMDGKRQENRQTEVKV